MERTNQANLPYVPIFQEEKRRITPQINNSLDEVQELVSNQSSLHSQAYDCQCRIPAGANRPGDSRGGRRPANDAHQPAALLPGRAAAPEAGIPSGQPHCGLDNGHTVRRLFVGFGWHPNGRQFRWRRRRLQCERRTASPFARQFGAHRTIRQSAGRRLSNDFGNGEHWRIGAGGFVAAARNVATIASESEFAAITIRWDACFICIVVPIASRHQRGHSAGEQNHQLDDYAFAAWKRIAVGHRTGVRDRCQSEHLLFVFKVVCGMEEMRPLDVFRLLSADFLWFLVNFVIQVVLVQLCACFVYHKHEYLLCTRGDDGDI